MDTPCDYTVSSKVSLMLASYLWTLVQAKLFITFNTFIKFHLLVCVGLETMTTEVRAKRFVKHSHTKASVIMEGITPCYKFSISLICQLSLCLSNDYMSLVFYILGGLHLNWYHFEKQDGRHLKIPFLDSNSKNVSADQFKT